MEDLEPDLGPEALFSQCKRVGESGEAHAAFFAASIAAHTRAADVVVAAAGVPNMITADMIREGAVLVDVGVSRVDGKTVGDLAPDVWEKAAWVTPNPGGVGPMTRAMLLSNVVDRAEALHAG